MAIVYSPQQFAIVSRFKEHVVNPAPQKTYAFSAPRSPDAPIRRSPVTACIAVVALLLAGCNGDSSGPGLLSNPRITIVAGGGATDTIGTMITTPLTVSVLDSAGEPAVGTVVRFEVDATPGPRVFLARASNGIPLATLVEMPTDVNGRASVYLYTGLTAGAAAVHVSAPAFSISKDDTVTIRPGLRARIRVPADTAVYVDGTFIMPASTVTDRNDNAYPDAVTYSSSDATISVTQGVVTGRKFGPAQVTAQSGSLTASINVAVVPRGSFAARVWEGTNIGVAVMNLDLSNYQSLASTLRNPVCSGCALPLVKPRWNANGSRIVYSAGYDQGSFERARVVSVAVGGVTQDLITPPAPQMASDPSYSPDGAWLYFVQGDDWQSYVIRRSRTDGTSPESVPAANPAEFGAERRPALSPDGTLLAYSVGYIQPRIRIRGVATGDRLPVDAPGTAPLWSPTGTQLAYVNSENLAGYSGELRLINADGSGGRRIAEGAYTTSFGWSPDGKYIIAEGHGAPNGIRIIEVATGTVVVVKSGSRLAEPSWRSTTQP